MTGWRAVAERAATGRAGPGSSSAGAALVWVMVCVGVTTAGCSGARPAERGSRAASDPGTAAAEAGGADKAAEAPFAEGQAVTLVLSTGKLRALTGEPLQGFHVPGVFVHRYVPGPQVEGDGTLADNTQGTPGWWELWGGGFQPAPTARPPMGPYVQGIMTREGVFIPTSRTVHGMVDATGPATPPP